MDLFALLSVIVGAYLVDSGVVNRAPLKTFLNVIRNPGAARVALKDSRGTGFAARTGPGSFSGANGSAQGTVNSPGIAAAIAFATAQIGKPYVWGATGPNAFDCSGLVQQAWKAGGYNLLRTSQLMAADPRLKTVNQSDLQPGDLVYPDLGHVQLYVGNGEVIEAANPTVPIRRVRMWGFFTANRVPLPAASVNPISGQPNTVGGAP